MVVWIKCENGTTNVCLQLRVPWSDVRGSGRAGGLKAAATERSPELSLQTSIHTEQAHHLQNRQKNHQTLVHLNIFFYSSRFKRKKTRCCWAVREHDSRRAELIAARRCTWSTSVLVLTAERKISVLPSFLDFSGCVVGLALTLMRQPNFYWDSLVQCRFFEDNSESAYAYGALRKSTDRLSGLRRVYSPVAELFFRKRKKKPLVNRKIQKSSERDFCRKTRQENCGGRQKMNELQCFSIRKCMIKVAARSGCPVSNPGPNNTIGLLRQLTEGNDNEPKSFFSPL